MELAKNVRHQFNVDDLLPGDWFLGCKCGYRLEKNVAAKNECPNCRSMMSIFDMPR